jgi:hypothetical protein
LLRDTWAPSGRPLSKGQFIWAILGLELPKRRFTVNQLEWLSVTGQRVYSHWRIEVSTKSLAGFRDRDSICERGD